MGAPCLWYDRNYIEGRGVQNFIMSEIQVCAFFKTCHESVFSPVSQAMLLPHTGHTIMMGC